MLSHHHLRLDILHLSQSEQNLLQTNFLLQLLKDFISVIISGLVCVEPPNQRPEERGPQQAVSD